MEEDWDTIPPSTKSWDSKKGRSGIGRGRPVKYDDEWTVPLGQSVAGGWEAAIGSDPEPKRGEWEKDFSTNQNSRDCPKQGGATTYYEQRNEGHMSQESPSAGVSKCYNPQESGHISRNCSNPRKEQSERVMSKNYNNQGDGQVSKREWSDKEAASSSRGTSS